ncbi:MAG: hypothetical protein KUF77_09740 [Candidatus Thiodiazotropha sp. (ex Lucina aurantia)]|nr:hypothetical protein [Candidatus Thiodiazotropha taylori]MBV2097836.1 hypothetical protein [Candidatus Thiodiazotropha sp. (ex Codakia orbicularis)]MBV2103291.1 hypothetical protein [Candidatus Thiodiazotropha sp. (ex Lucina aurantia)]MBV2116346.1 hypothetical protein [Candidatus Thiodiazotropha sp. (ex Lucina aurantia)]
MTTQDNSSKKSAPIATFKSGLIQANVWENEITNPNTGEVKPIFNISLQRSYFNKKKNEWDHTSSFSAEDIPAIQDLLRDAHRFAKDAKQQALMQRIQSGSQVSPVIPPQADMPQEAVAAQ